MTIFKRMVFALLGLLGLVAVVLLVSRLWPASALQKQARAALEQPLDWPGANAWALLETLEHDGLDMAQRQALVDERVRRFERWILNKQASISRDDPLVQLPAGIVALVPQPPALGGDSVRWQSSDVLCHRSQVADCLDKVRQAPDAVAAELATRQPRLQRVAQLAAYGHVRSPYPADASMPFPHTLGGLFDSLTGHALAHAKGSSTQAMAGLCRDIGTGRMLLGHSDSILVAMTGQSMLEANTLLLAQILAELPPTTPLPDSCAAALLPLSVEQMSLCTPVRGDYAMVAAVTRQSYEQELADIPGGSWLFNVDKTLNRNAVYMGQGCLAPLRQRMVQDMPAQPDLAVSSIWRIECPANAIGCILTGIAGPAYTDYILRAQDVGAQQRLLATLVWLRAQPADEPLAQRLLRLPPELISPQRPIRLSADGRALQVDSYYRKGRPGNDPLSVPLPHDWWPAAAAAPALGTAADMSAP